MMQKGMSMLVATALTLSTVAGSFAPAAAAPRMAPVTAAPSVEAGGIVQVGENRWWKHNRPGGWNGRGNWDRDWNRHGNWNGDRHHFRRDRHFRHHGHDDDFGPALAFGLFALGTGVIASQGHNSSWAAACDRKYDTFNWRTGMFMGNDGRHHRCRLP
jgi:hypothetical protein